MVFPPDFGVMKPNLLSSCHKEIFPFSNVIFWFQWLTPRITCRRQALRVSSGFNGKPASYSRSDASVLMLSGTDAFRHCKESLDPVRLGRMSLNHLKVALTHLVFEASLLQVARSSLLPRLEVCSVLEQFDPVPDLHPLWTTPALRQALHVPYSPSRSRARQP